MCTQAYTQLDHFLKVLPFINDLTTTDFGVSLTDRTKYLLYKPGKTLDLGVKAGDPVRENSAVYRAMQENRRVVIRAGKELFGKPYIAVAIPLHDDSGEVIGAACLQESVERQETLKQMAAEILNGIREQAANTEKISARAHELAAVGTSMAAVASDFMARTQETDAVLGFIKSVAGQTNLLGLNAAIEAARVGEAGRGFGVVAEEIRKLANNSAGSVAKIAEMLKAIQEDGKRTSAESRKIEAIATDVAGAIAAIASATQQLSSMGEMLDRLAESLSADC